MKRHWSTVLCTATTLWVLGVLSGAGCSGNAAPKAADGGADPLSRSFECNQAAVGTEAAIGVIEGEPGASLVIRPEGTAPCRFALFFRDANAMESRLSQPGSPGGYLLAQSLATASARIVCASNISHEAAGATRRVTGATLECAVGGLGAMSTLLPVIDPRGAWAAWLLEVRAVQPETFDIFYIRDSTFQFHNLSDEGRPSDDGIYRTRLRAASMSGFDVVETEKTSDRVIPPESVYAEAWEPTAEERARFDYMSFDNGECPPTGGCPVTEGSDGG
jgi:hypothetical protein